MPQMSDNTINVLRTGLGRQINSTPLSLDMLSYYYMNYGEKEGAYKRARDRTSLAMAIAMKQGLVKLAEPRIVTIRDDISEAPFLEEKGGRMLMLFDHSGDYEASMPTFQLTDKGAEWTGETNIRTLPTKEVAAPESWGMDNPVRWGASMWRTLFNARQATDYRSVGPPSRFLPAEEQRELYLNLPRYISQILSWDFVVTPEAMTASALKMWAIFELRQGLGYRYGAVETFPCNTSIDWVPDGEKGVVFHFARCNYWHLKDFGVSSEGRERMGLEAGGGAAGKDLMQRIHWESERQADRYET